MAKRDKLKDLERKYGKPAIDLILPLVAQGGQSMAAHLLGISQMTVSKCLKDNGYTPRIVYVHADGTEQPTTQPESEGAVING